MKFTTLLYLLWSAVALAFSRHIADCRKNCQRNTRLYDDLIDHHADKSIADQSIAPWTYSKDEDAARRPRIIPIISCKSEFCESVDKKKGPNPLLIAVPIHYNIRVYYIKSRKNNLDELVPGTFKVSVGCTCIRRP